MRQVPPHADYDMRQFLEELRRKVEDLSPSTLPIVGSPTNLTVTPGPGTNTIQFTANDGADRHLLYISETGTWDPTKAGSYVIDLGSSTLYVDHVGRAAVKRYYWLVGITRTGIRSDPPTGPKSSTTLSLTTPGTVPRYVPPSTNLKRTDLSGQPSIIAGRSGGRPDVR